MSLLIFLYFSFLAKDPIYVLENNVPIDTNHYLEHQLMNPLLRIFEPIIGENKTQNALFSKSHFLY